MKQKIILMAVLCTFAFHATAQTDKGNFLLGGTISYRTSRSESNQARSRSYSLSPKIGYFITDNFAAGISLSYARGTHDESFYFDKNGLLINQNGLKENNTGLGIFTRYYINISNSFKFLAQLDANGTDMSTTFIHENRKIEGSTFKYREYAFNLRPGFAYIPSKKWSFELAFPLLTYYKTVNSKEMRDPNFRHTGTSFFSFGLRTFTPSIGFNYHF